MTDELTLPDAETFLAAYGPAAVVTGGASGIGAEYCRQLARFGFDLVIVDRDEAGLEVIARELGDTAPGVAVRTATVDLTAPAATVLDEVRAAVGTLDIGLLVANAAWSPVGPFLEMSLDALVATIELNCRAPAALAHEFGGRLAARGRGGIIVMSSMAAESGTAQVALYSATKAFDLVLAEGLWYELRDRGVDVLAVQPGSTDTPGWRGSQPHAPDLRGVLTPSDVVRDAFASLGQEPSVVPGVANRGAAAMFRGMERREVIEMMSSITSRLGPAGT